ncbi:MAG: aspartate:alanine exchanger family transporter [Microscillaceae bacterium]
MNFLIEILLENKLLLLFLVIALGYFLGKLNIGGFSLGIAAVLFVGIFFGSLHPEMFLPDVIYTVGLVLFVYTIGLRSGPSFFASFKKSGFRDNLLVIGILLISALFTAWVGHLLALKNTLIAGVFCGSLTNTPALASLIDVLKQSQASLSPEALRQVLAEPVIGYSLTYPIGVMGVLLLFQLGMRIWHIRMADEQAATARITGVSRQPLRHINLKITNPTLDGKTIDEIEDLLGLDLTVSRHLPHSSHHILIPAEDTDRLRVQDIITLVGTEEELARIQVQMGELTEQDLVQDRGEVDYRRMFVSNPKIVGKTIAQLKLHARYQAVVTRLRRGDMDLPVRENMVLEAGDRVRVIAPKENMEAVGKYLGDSYQHLSEVDYISISIGISLGLLVGMVAIPLPGGSQFKLGFAAGALLVALVLGKLGRTGPITWTMSYNANLTLRQMGAVFFLAGIGLKAGYSFFSTFQRDGLQLILFGAGNTLLTAGLTIVICRYFFRMPYNLIMGLIAALHTQPACLAYANEKDETGAANISYATVFPMAMIGKILLAQWLLG